MSKSKDEQHESSEYQDNNFDIKELEKKLIEKQLNWKKGLA